MNSEGVVVSVSGKGGVGKSTVAALILKALVDSGRGSILVVDADPDSNLADLLGLETSRTVAEIAAKLKDDIAAGRFPPEFSKRDYFETRIFEILHEEEKFDLLVMGRGEGEGCYCAVNDLLTSILDTLSKNYSITLMDMEAGLEHLSRRTDRDVDIMVIVVDRSRLSYLTARRIRDLAKEVHIDFKRIVTVGNRVEPEFEEVVKKRVEEIGLEYAGLIPVDPNIASYDMEGRSLLELPESSPAVKAAKEITRKIGLT